MNIAFHVPGDLELKADGSDLLFVEGPDALLEEVTRGFQIPQGYYTFDRQEGIRLIDGILQKGAKRAMQEEEIRRFLLTFEAVESVERVTLRTDRSARILFAEFVVITAAGPVTGAAPFLLT